MALVRVLGALLLLALALPTATAAQEAPDPSVLRAIEAQVTEIRGLAPQADVPLRVLDPSSLRELLVTSFDRDYLPHERESDQKLLVALGLLRPTDDLVQIQLELLQGQVIGVYDPDDRLMFVLGNQGPFGPAERVTYAHEFNHALQDQHYDLNVMAPKHPLSNDRSLAAHALLEGDAVLLQALWSARHLTAEDLAVLARGATSGDATLARVPPVVRAELIFPYLEGFNFVRKFFRDGGESYAAIEQLFRDPPTSTAEVLHPERYAAGWRPVDVTLPELTPQLGPDWRYINTGVLGELDTRVLLEQYGERTEAYRVAAGWTGDRWQLLEHNGRTALVLRSTWASDSAASAFFSAYKRGLRTRFNAASTEEDSSTRQALSTPVAATDLQLAGQQVTLVLAFDRQTAHAISGTLSAVAP